MRAAGQLRGQLPRRLGRLIGRTRELDEIDRALTASPMVTLVGPGGIGKTRLALAAADRAASRTDGACLVDLSAVGTDRDVARAVADTIAITESPARTLPEAIVATLRNRTLVLLVDNCEHVPEGAARICQAVAEACPGVRVLATSREPLAVPAEAVVAVAPLEPAGAAAELFVERARALDAHFDPDAGRADVVEICRRLDGVPLAIELAAARTRSLTTAQIRDRLDDRLRLLTGGRRDRVERHRTLRATIQWSFDLLTADERRLFSRLSVFTGPFDLAAAERVAAGDGVGAVDVDDLIGSPGRAVHADGGVRSLRSAVPVAGDDAPLRGRAAGR